MTAVTSRVGPADKSSEHRYGCDEHVVCRMDRAILTHILQPGINLAVWRRDTPDPIAAWLRACPLEDTPLLSSDIDITVPAVCVPTELAAAVGGQSHCTRVGVSALAHDAGTLANIVSRIAGNPNVRVRLEWVRERQCAYFHADRIAFRLVCTYRGAGTEWISNATAGKLTSPESEPPPSEIHRLVPGDVAIMRGLSRALDAGPPLKHRSPPADSLTGWRLFLAIDPICSSERTLATIAPETFL